MRIDLPLDLTRQRWITLLCAAKRANALYWYDDWTQSTEDLEGLRISQTIIDRVANSSSALIFLRHAFIFDNDDDAIHFKLKYL